jgi:hypothetical protein
MTRTWGIICAAGLALAGSSSAFAKGITYDCDTAANHFSELSLPAGPAFTVSGRLQILNMAPSKQYAPLARLSISNATTQPGPSSEGWAGFEFGNLPGSKGLPTGLLQSTAFTKGAAKQDAALGIASSRDVAFSLAFTGTSVNMTIDGHQAALPFQAEQPIVRIVCSTGEFLFYDMEITPSR